MAGTWDHAKGCADEQSKKDALLIRAVNEENRKLKSDLELHTRAREPLEKLKMTRQISAAAERTRPTAKAQPRGLAPQSRANSTPAQTMNVEPPPLPDRCPLHPSESGSA
eukprot:7571761-Pyramimonas_sp.AAC.2